LSSRRAKIRVHVGVPIYGATPALCQLSFGTFVGNGVAAGLIHHLGEVEGAYIDRARNDLVRQAMAGDATHIMFVDQDMVLPQGALQRLLRHQVPFVGGSYWGKDDLFTPVSFHLDPFRRIYELEDCPIVPTEAGGLPDGIFDCWCGKPDDHLHQVGGVGMGCTLIAVSLLKKIERHFTKHKCPCGYERCDSQRWFSTKETGEDIHFAIRAREVGVDALLDGFIQCGHVRNQIVTRQHYDWARKHAPKCKIRGCGRLALWQSGDHDQDRLLAGDLVQVTPTRCFLHQPGV
jgi:hypothetical protein